MAAWRRVCRGGMCTCRGGVRDGGGSSSTLLVFIGLLHVRSALASTHAAMEPPITLLPTHTTCTTTTGFVQNLEV